MFWQQTQAREEIRKIPHCTPCSYISSLSGDYPDTRHRKRRSNKAAGVLAEKDRHAMSFLEKKVEDLKLTVSDTVRGRLDFVPLRQY